MTYFANHTGPDNKPPPKEKKGKKPMKRTVIKKISPTSLNALLNAARVVFQKWIVKRDAGKPCISCDSKLYKPHATHFFKAELFPGLIFSEYNTHSGCAICNIYLDGNTDEYRKKLPNRIGEMNYICLVQSSDNARNRKYTREELNQIITKYKT